MQELLKEEDFLIKQYNPTKLFRLFYAIAVIEVIISYFIISGKTDTLVFLILLFPLLTPLTMFFWRKENKALSVNTIALVNIILTVIYFFGSLMIRLILNPEQFFTYETIEGWFAILIILCIYYIISLCIILLYLKIKRDIKKVKA